MVDTPMGSPKFLVHERWFSSVCNTIDMVWSRFDFSPHTAYTMPQYDPTQKPPAHICPQHFCFFWQERGDFAAPGLYPSLADALRDMHEIERSACGCSFGRCVRDPDGSGPIDWYEPCEPALAQAALPWFYFTPGPHKLIPELHDQYITESELLWGSRHWEQGALGKTPNKDAPDP